MALQVATIIFSKDRALQLDATLASLALHCRDLTLSEIKVLYRVSSPLHRSQYDQLAGMYPYVSFIEEIHFREQLLSVLKAENTLFLVDDNLFVREFYFADVLDALNNNLTALGFSLRLGRNTTYCYSLIQEQTRPDFLAAASHRNCPMLRFKWVGASCDFGYPLEVSSSIYRTAEILPTLEQLQFTNPNSLEGALAECARLYAEVRPDLLCFEQSVTFCNPVNKVQQQAPHNRAGSNQAYQSEDLAQIFAVGTRISVNSYSGFLPNACHQEVAIQLCRHEKSEWVANIKKESSGKAANLQASATQGRVSVEQPPLITVVIPCYKQAHFLPDAVNSVIYQTYTQWECVIVNDGSPDETSAVARAIIRENPGRKISLLEKDNEGLAEARNSAISITTGEWILPLDSDDKFAPAFMEKTLAVAQSEPGINHVSSFLQEFGAKNNILQVFPFSRDSLLRGNMFPYASLYKRTLWERYGGYLPIIPFGAEDYNFWVTCSLDLKPSRVQEPLFWYRKHQGSSMVDAVISHQMEVDACLHTIHTEAYSVESLLRDHAALAFMHADTRAVIDKNIAKFPQYSQLYLWRGLDHETKGKWRQALRDYQTAARLAKPQDWQPLFRLIVLNSKQGLGKDAGKFAKELLRGHPDFPVRPQLEKIIELAA
jgi:glycosyltransferase involved in cell wall biosynthesis